jgi:hypothetical protein
MIARAAFLSTTTGVTTEEELVADTISESRREILSALSIGKAQSMNAQRIEYLDINHN